MQAGQQIGPFTVEKELGNGAMGTVYRARYTKTGQLVAIKVVLPGLHTNAGVVARFEREVSILKQFGHPNIVKLYASGKFQGSPFYAMEYIDGEPLDKILERRGRLDWREVVSLGKQLCQALQHAHERGVVHRDLKPSNLMVMLDGTLKLTDFGIAKDLDVTQLTATNSTIGTASYMSPEQCQGAKNLTPKSDLYALGVVFYEMLTGQHPFQADTLMDMFMQHVQGKFERPSRHILDIPVWLDKLVCQLLEKDPKDRPASAERVGLALADVMQKGTTPVSPKTPTVRGESVKGSRVGRGTQRNKTLFSRSLIDVLKGRRKKGEPAWYEQTAVQAAGLVAVLAGVAFLLWQSFKPASADRLFAEARTLMESRNEEDWDKARDGPVEAYLTRFPQRDDDQARQLREWADLVDLKTRERQLNNRFKRNLTPEGEAEPIAFAAVRRENEGDLTGADERWQELATFSDASDRSLRSFALLAHKRRLELRAIEGTYKGLRTKVDQARQAGRELQPEGRPDQLAVRAVRAELFGDLFLARDFWKELRQEYEKNLDQRPLVLLAAARDRDLSAQITRAGDVQPLDVRKKLIGDEFEKAAKHLATNAPNDLARARMLCREIVALYDKESDPAIQDVVQNKAKKLLEQKTP